MNVEAVSLSAKMRNMSLLCALLVVAMHIGGGRPGALSYLIMQIIANGVCRMAVPFFFFAAGYWMSRHLTEKEWWHTEVHKRVRTLLVPFIIWCFVDFIFTAPLVVLANLKAGRSLCTNFMLGWDAFRYVGLYPFDYPALRPLWFLRALLILVLISPLIVVFVRKIPCIFLCTIFCALVYCNSFLQTFSPIWHLFGTVFSVLGIFYFSVGLLLGEQRMLGRLLEHKYLMSLFLFVGLSGVVIPKVIAYYGNCMGFMLSVFNDISVPFLLLGMMAVMPSMNLSSLISNMAFPLYLVHMFPIMLFGIFLTKDVSNMGVLVCKYIFAISLSFCVVALMRKFFPRASNILFGGR